MNDVIHTPDAPYYATATISTEVYLSLKFYKVGFTHNNKKLLRFVTAQNEEQALKIIKFQLGKEANYITLENCTDIVVEAVPEVERPHPIEVSSWASSMSVIDPDFLKIT